MESVRTVGLSTEELTAIGVSAIIAKAATLSRDRELDLWRDIYEPAKRAIAEFGLPPAEYQRAIAELTEALKI